MKDQGRGPATYVVPWAPHLLNWALPYTFFYFFISFIYTEEVS